MPLFLVLKPEYPHESASNTLFNVKKGEILECPPNYKPSSAFQVCENKEAAQQYIKIAYAENAVPGTSFPVVSQSAKEEDKPTPAYPLFRRVSSPDGSEQQYRLFARDVYRFLAREETDVLIDIQNIKINEKTAQQLLDCELKQSAPRKEVVALLKELLSSLCGEGKGGSEKEVEKISQGVTSPEAIKLSP